MPLCAASLNLHILPELSWSLWEHFPHEKLILPFFFVAGKSLAGRNRGIHPKISPLRPTPHSVTGLGQADAERKTFESIFNYILWQHEGGKTIFQRGLK